MPRLEGEWTRGRTGKLLQTSFVPFVEFSWCPKCGLYATMRCTYIGPAEIDGLHVNEHLKWECPRCAFLWRTQTQDAKAT